MDTFNVIAGSVTIVSFIVSLYFYLREKFLKKNLEAGLIGIIGNLDDLVYYSNCGVETQSELVAKSTMIRNQAIAVLKSFSKNEERYRTFDFGFNDQNVLERIKKRKESLGVDYDGCIVGGQKVMTIEGEKYIELIDKETKILSKKDDGLNEYSIVKSNNKHKVRNFIEINGVLKLTANNKIYVKERGWVLASEITIGDVLFDLFSGELIVFEIKLINKESDVFALKAEPFRNLYLNSILVHNEEEEK